MVPGVGAYAACMRGLGRAGGVELIRDLAAAGHPVLGICVGHQILFDEGNEHGVVTAGVGVFEGAVGPLGTRRLPHMGWNSVAVAEGSRLFAGLEDQRFYFVHSYAATVAPPGALVTTSEHEGRRFIAAVERGSVTSTQFHPEKSGSAGARLIANWLGNLE